MRFGAGNWIATALLVGGLALLVGAAASWFGFPPVGALVVGVLAAAIGLFVALLLGNRRGRQGPGVGRETEPLWPYLSAGPPRQPRQFAPAIEDYGGEGSAAGWAIAALILTVAVGGSALAFVATRDNGSEGPLEADALADGPTVAPAATVTPLPPSPKATEVPPTATPEPPTATPEPPTATPEPPTATPEREDEDDDGDEQSDAREQARIDLDGQWQITDVVAWGRDAGSTFTFTVQLDHDGKRVTGGGDGLYLNGSIEDRTLWVEYELNGSRGEFEWILLGEGWFAGEFEDFGSENGGISTLVRLGR